MSVMNSQQCLSTKLQSIIFAPLFQKEVFLDRENHAFECKLLASSEPLPSGVKHII